MTAIKIAQQAASEAFDKFLGRNTAAMRVPDCVIRAARVAYAKASGRVGVKVVGHGNRTHPVIGVTVYSDCRRAAIKEQASALRRYAAEIESELRD